MDSMDAQRPMAADPAQGQPARFDPEDLVHLQALLGDTSPRSSPATSSHLGLQVDQGAREPATISVQTRAEKQRERFRKRYHNRVVRASLVGSEADGHPRALFSDDLANRFAILAGYTHASEGRSCRTRVGSTKNIGAGPRRQGRQQAFAGN